MTKSIEEEGNIIIIEAADNKGRGLLIGRAAENLRNFEGIVTHTKYFDLENFFQTHNIKNKNL